MFKKADLNGIGLYLFNGDEYVVDVSLPEEEFKRILHIEKDRNGENEICSVICKSEYGRTSY